MLLVITPYNRHYYQDILVDFFAARYRIFKEKLGWDLKCQHGLEKDQFDHSSAYYLIYLDSRRKVIGGARMICTDTAHMTRDIFHDAVDRPMDLTVSHQVFECSRFFVDEERCQKIFSKNSGGSKKIASKILVGVMEFCLMKDLTHMITVSEPRMERKLRMFGWPLKRLGSPKDMGDSIAIVGKADVSLRSNRELREKTGIHHAVLNYSL